MHTSFFPHHIFSANDQPTMTTTTRPKKRKGLSLRRRSSSALKDDRRKNRSSLNSSIIFSLFFRAAPFVAPLSSTSSQCPPRPLRRHQTRGRARCSCSRSRGITARGAGRRSRPLRCLPGPPRRATPRILRPRRRSAPRGTGGATTTRGEETGFLLRGKEYERGKETKRRFRSRKREDENRFQPLPSNSPLSLSHLIFKQTKTKKLDQQRRPSPRRGRLPFPR